LINYSPDMRVSNWWQNFTTI